MYMPSIFNNSVFDNFEQLDGFFFPGLNQRLVWRFLFPADEDGCQGNR